MKEIKAIIQPFMLQDVCDALSEIKELPGLTVSHVLGFGRTRDTEAPDTDESREHSFDKKTKLEIVVGDDLAALVLEVIARSARTGKAGDGKIFVLDVSDVVMIRTGDHGPGAL